MRFTISGSNFFVRSLYYNHQSSVYVRTFFTKNIKKKKTTVVVVGYGSAVIHAPKS
jgi:hypothetical protein